MYTLRRISGQGVQMNFALGKSYTVVDRYASYGSFQSDFYNFFGRTHVSDLDDNADDDSKSIYAFIGNEGGTEVYPLYIGQQAYIMTESGSTFSNLTLKETTREPGRC